MAVGCVLLPLGSLRRIRFCLGAYALDYLEEEGEVGELGWAVPPGVARVGHAPALLLGFHVNRAADLDSIAFGALVPGLKSLV